MSRQVTSSAPGKLMILGEHAVLHGNHSIVCAVDQRIFVTITEFPHHQLKIVSRLGEYQKKLDQVEITPPFEFVLAAVKKFQAKLHHGICIEIRSEFSHQVGLGSSAATTVACVAALSQWTEQAVNPEQVFQTSYQIIQQVQGKGSGADLAASVYGGVVLYRQQPGKLKKLSNSCPLVVIYSQYKEKTTQVVQMVEKAREKWPEIFNHIYQTMDLCALEAEKALNQQDWPTLGELVNINQGLMDAIGVNDHTLSSIVYKLRSCAGVYGSKISGSGLGDCVIAIGKTDQEFSWPVLPLQVSPQGVEIENQS